MLRNYLIIAWRNLWKHKTFSLVNIMGLAIGIAAFLIILQYVNYHRSFDDFHPDGERLYRIASDYYKHDQLHSSHALTVGGVGTLINSNIPEVEAMTRINPFSGTGLVSKDSVEGNAGLVAPSGTIYFADSTFFKVFDFPLLAGDLQQMENPDAVFISRSAAQAIFDTQDPLSQWINIRNQDTNLSYFVAGVFNDQPDNSHIRIDYILPLVNQGDWFVDDFGWSEFYTYVKLYENQVPNTVADKISDGVADRRKLDPTFDHTHSQYYLQPVREIHINETLNNEPSETINPRTLGLLITAAFFILFIAYINYINLSLNQSNGRAGEIGIRKVIGAGKPQLMRQFIFEALLINFLSVVVAIVIVKVSSPYFQNLVTTTYPVLLVNWVNLAIIIFTLLLGTLVSGFYPALILSTFNPATIIKGQLQGISNRFEMRKALTVIQFSTTLLLVIGSYSIYSQINHMRNQDLGFEVDQTLVLDIPLATDSTYNHRLEGFGKTLSNETFVKGFTGATSIPGRTIDWYTDGVQRISDPDYTLSSRIQSVDYGYLSSFELDLIAGRDFDERLDAGQNVMMINETAVKNFGFNSVHEAIGSQMTGQNQDPCTIVGVVADYHHESLKQSYEPTVYFLKISAPQYLAVKMQSVNNENIATIRSHWEQFFGDNPFSYFFLDDYFDQQYQADVRFGKILGLFAVLAMLVAGMGLLALTMSVVSIRTKEIGIRKILGASISQVLLLLSTDLVRLIIISFLITIPLIYLGIKDWLNDFAFRMDISIWLFALPGGVVFVVSLAIISIMSAKVALANPVDSLRAE